VDPVKRKVISELFFAPSVVLPFVGGISAGLLSWAAGGIDAFTAAAAIGILGGVGWMATRVIFMVEQITDAAMKLQVEQQVKASNERLDQLKRELETDGDSRTQEYLTLLRSLRDDFLAASNRSGVQQRSSQLRERVNEVFEAAVAQLRETLEIARLAESLTGDARRRVLADREKLINEVGKTVDHLRTTIHEFHLLTQGDQRPDLTALREELEASMRVAKRTEERLREIESPDSASRPSPETPSSNRS
jgi:hypothetical protein